MLEPGAAGNGHQCCGENDAGQVVKNPARKAFIAGWGGGCNRGVTELPLQHMPQPAADEPVVEGRDLEGAGFDRGHKVHEQGRAYTQGGCVNNDFNHGHFNYPLPVMSSDCLN